jgi:hypothetical protein
MQIANISQMEAPERVHSESEDDIWGRREDPRFSNEFPST